MKVVDASALFAGLADDGPVGARVVRLLETEELTAPALVDIEVCSVLRNFVLAGRLTADVAHRSLARLARLPIVRQDHGQLLSRCWQLRHNVTPYDAAYVALAEALGVPLVTTDARLARATGPRCAFEVLA